MLLTPQTAATVVDPGSEFVLTTYLSKKPGGEFSYDLFRSLERFLRASYCIDASPLHEAIATGRFPLASVGPDASNDGWLHVTCRFVTTHKDPAKSAEGTLDAWLAPDEGFAIRKARLVLGEPYMSEILTEAGPYVQLPTGGWVPQAFSLRGYRLTTEQPKKTSRASDDRVLTQGTDFELVGGVETAEIPDSYFTLESLGVHPRARWLRRWLLVCAFAAVLLLALFVMRKRRSRPPAA